MGGGRQGVGLIGALPPVRLPLPPACLPSTQVLLSYDFSPNMETLLGRNPYSLLEQCWLHNRSMFEAGFGYDEAAGVMVSAADCNLMGGGAYR